jgi:hypothetical protein
MFEQERVIVRLQQRVLQERDIQVCFLSGSYGRGQADGYSDLDVVLVFADAAARDRAWSDRRNFVSSAMPYVPVKSFDAGHVRPYFHVALYSNGSKVDFRYETKTELTATIWDRDLKILKDGAGWAPAFQAAAAQAPLSQPLLSAAELQALDERFWVMVWDVLRLVLRGEYDKPFGIYVQLLYFTLPPLLAVLPAEDAARQGLLRASFSADTAQTAVHLKNLVHAYLAARTAVVQRFHLQFTVDDRFEREILALLARKVDF